MSVKVIKNKVFDGVKTYEVGDVIEGLSENDKSQLILDGIVEYIGTRPGRKREIKRYTTPNTIINEDIKADTRLVDIIDKKEDTKEDVEENKEEDQVQIIDPNSFALKADEYVNAPAVETKKEKAIEMLKDYFASDMAVFFNVGEFAETHTIDNIEKVITIDNEKIKEVSKATNQGISLGEILYSIPVVEYGKVPHVGDSQIFDKKLLYISSVSEDIGLYEIILTQNLGE